MGRAYDAPEATPVQARERVPCGTSAGKVTESCMASACAQFNDRARHTCRAAGAHYSGPAWGHRLGAFQTHAQPGITYGLIAGHAG